LSPSTWPFALGQRELQPCELLERNERDNSELAALKMLRQRLEAVSELALLAGGVFAEEFENLEAEVLQQPELIAAKFLIDAWLTLPCTLRDGEVCWQLCKLLWRAAPLSWCHGEWLLWRRDDVASNGSNFLEQSMTLEALLRSLPA
jgi:hypothetical protein